MTVADIGTGGGAMAMVLGRLLGSGRIYATDITQRSLTMTRRYHQEGRADQYHGDRGRRRLDKSSERLL